jgi:hypothetical protein
LGVVLMHGKGGSPDKHVAGLANALRQQGVLVANLDMPWSGRREYDADVASAVTSGEEALQTLRSQGRASWWWPATARAGCLRCIWLDACLDGVIAIAPGGNVGAACCTTGWPTRWPAPAACWQQAMARKNPAGGF